MLLLFQALMNDVLTFDQFVFIYLDYILIFSKTTQAHLCQVLQHLLEKKLFVKADKCAFQLYAE